MVPERGRGWRFAVAMVAATLALLLVFGSLGKVRAAGEYSAARLTGADTDYLAGTVVTIGTTVPAADLTRSSD